MTRHCSGETGNPSSLASAYDRWRTSEVGAITDEIERRLILELVGDVAGFRALDIGCGDGELALELAGRGANMTGIDASKASIEAATKRAMERDANVTFEVAKAEALPFPSGRFDVVTAITILCFVEDPAPVFREISRILRPGGRLVIGELGKWNSWAAARRLRALLGSQLWRSARFRTAGELRACAEEAGLMVEELRGAVFYPRLANAARLLSPLDRYFGRFTTFGAAFIALAAVKPPE